MVTQVHVPLERHREGVTGNLLPVNPNKIKSLHSGVPIAMKRGSASAHTGEKMKAMLRKLWHEDEGQDLAEYGLLLILIAVAVVTGITAFKSQIVSAFSSATSVLSGS